MHHATLSTGWRTILAAALFAASVPVAAAEPTLVTGQVEAIAAPHDPAIPARFRLPAESFAYEERPLGPISERMTLSLVTFPSPVVTDSPANNTVHCEYYRPVADGKSPGVIVLHILGGDFPLARAFCNVMAQRGSGALLLKMPYYGPRRDPAVRRRMISSDPRETVEGMTQAILDIRRATTWLGTRDEIDPERLGVFGISLGGITGALATGVEPRLRNACLLLAGGDISQVLWNSPEMADVRQAWTARGGTPEEFFEIMRQIDPITYAEHARGRRILMLNASHDEVVPPACSRSLWEAFGQPEIVWYDAGHYTAARHLLDALDRVPEFFAQP